jgi:hypothetical protein
MLAVMDISLYADLFRSSKDHAAGLEERAVSRGVCIGKVLDSLRCLMVSVWKSLLYIYNDVTYIRYIGEK